MYVLYISAGQMLKGKNSVMEIHKKESRPLEKSGATACEKFLSVNKKFIAVEESGRNRRRMFLQAHAFFNLKSLNRLLGVHPVKEMRRVWKMILHTQQTRVQSVMSECEEMKDKMGKYLSMVNAWARARDVLFIQSDRFQLKLSYQ